MKKLTEYFDYEANDYKHQEFVEFQLQISRKKVDKLPEDPDADGYGMDSDCKFKFKSENCYTCRWWIILHSFTAGQKIEKSPGKKTREII